MGKERTLQSPVVWSTALFHLCCLSPITEQNTCPVFANPPLQVLNQSKASTASKQLSSFKTHLLSSAQTLDLCPQGSIWCQQHVMYNLLLTDNTSSSVYRQQGICLGANPQVPAIKERQEHKTGGTASKDPALRPPSPAGCSSWCKEQKCAVPFIHIGTNALHSTSSCLKWEKTAFY